MQIGSISLLSFQKAAIELGVLIGLARLRRP